MTLHEAIVCPRCGARFECKAGTIHLCQCNQVPLTETESAAIAERYAGCLCADCLRTLKTEMSHGAQGDAPRDA